MMSNAFDIAYSMMMITILLLFVFSLWVVILFLKAKQSDSGEFKAEFRGMRVTSKSAWPPLVVIFFTMFAVVSIWLNRPVYDPKTEIFKSNHAGNAKIMNLINANDDIGLVAELKKLSGKEDQVKQVIYGLHHLARHDEGAEIYGVLNDLSE